MKLEILLIAVVTFISVDMYYDNMYTKRVGAYKKHFKIAGMLFAVFSTYLFLKRNPGESATMMSQLSSAIRYMPIDKQSKDLISPWLTPGPETRMLTSGGVTGGKVERCVSGTKKKYVAASQGWKCGECKTQLDAWFEVDHKTRLADGGSNHISNLVALCRTCHGQKTGFENL